MTVLKGESLINDAAALTLFTFAVATVTGAHLFIEGRFLFFMYSAIAGTLVGIVIRHFFVNRRAAGGPTPRSSPCSRCWCRSPPT